MGLNTYFHRKLVQGWTCGEGMHALEGSPAPPPLPSAPVS